MGSSQFWVRKGLGTRKAIVGIQVSHQNCYEDVCLCFKDYEKAFELASQENGSRPNGHKLYRKVILAPIATCQSRQPYMKSHTN